MQSGVQKKESYTMLAGSNMLEMLTFHINQKEFGINVFKVKELIPYQRITKMPHQSKGVSGAVCIRGKTMPLIDIASLLGNPSLKHGEGIFVVTEINRKTQALWVSNVNKIQKVNWEDVVTPPAAARSQMLTSVVKSSSGMIGMLDLENLFDAIYKNDNQTVTLFNRTALSGRSILVVDDSRTARRLISRCITAMGGEFTEAEDGAQAWSLLNREDKSPLSFDLIVSDIEMPRLDGYTLAKQVKDTPFTAHIPVLLHSSMSGDFNKEMAMRVGADFYLAKFNAEELQSTLIKAVPETQ